MHRHHLVQPPVAPHSTVRDGHHASQGPDIVGRAFADGALIVVGLVKEQSVGSGGHQGLHAGLGGSHISILFVDFKNKMNVNIVNNLLVTDCVYC